MATLPLTGEFRNESEPSKLLSIRNDILSFGDAFFCNPVLICPDLSCCFFHAVAAPALLISLWLHWSIARLANARTPEHTSHSTSRIITLAAASRGVSLERNQAFLAMTRKNKLNVNSSNNLDVITMGRKIRVIQVGLIILKT